MTDKERFKMDEKMRKAQQVVEMTGVSYADTREALEQSEWDMLAAVISLEQQGKTERRSASYSTTPDDGTSGVSAEMRASQDRWHRDTQRTAFAESAAAFGRKVRDFMLIRLIVERDGEQVAVLPMFVVLIILIILRSIAVIGVIVSLFFGVRYKFEGLDAVTIDVNGTMDKMADMATSIREEQTASATEAAEPRDVTEPSAGTGWDAEGPSWDDDDGTSWDEDSASWDTEGTTDDSADSVE